MNLTKQKQNSIINYFIIKSPEMIEVEKLVEKINNEIYDIVSNSLSDSEISISTNPLLKDIYIIRDWLELKQFGENLEDIFDFPIPLDKIDYSYWKPDDYYYRKVYGILSRFHYARDRKAIPYKISNWKDLKSLDPTKFNEIQTNLKQCIELLDKLSYKIIELSKLLRSQEITLVNVKKYFPELYNLIKHGETTVK